MNTIKTLGHIEHGKLKILNREQFIENLHLFEGSQVELHLTRTVSPRSSKQNKYYFGVVVRIVQDRLLETTGELHKAETIHDLFKSLFNAIEIADANGEIVRIPQSTAGLNTAQFESYLSKIRFWAHDSLDIIIPLPNEDFSEL